MANASNKLQAALGISSVARNAQTIQEHEASVVRVSSELEDSRARLAQLEQERATIYLDGGNVSEFHDRLERTKVETESLRQAWETAKQRLADAKAAKYQKDLEENAKTVKDIDEPGLEAGLLDVHRLSNELAEAVERANRHMKNIAGSDENLKRHDRPDLVVDHRAVRARIVEELRGQVDESDKPVRRGRLDEPDFQYGYELFRATEHRVNVDENNRIIPDDRYVKWVKKHGSVNWLDHETDQQFHLRMMNWTTQRNAAIKREDPLNVAAKRALEGLEQFLRPEGAYEASRGVRRIEQSTFVGPNNEIIRKVRPVDGFGEGTYGPSKSVTME